MSKISKQLYLNNYIDNQDYIVSYLKTPVYAEP